MADETIGLNLNIDPEGNINKTEQGINNIGESIGQAEKKSQSFRAAIMAMQQELIRLAEEGKKGTQEYNDLFDKLTEKKDKVQELAKAVSLVEPSRQIEGFKVLSTTIVGGFQAATAAIAVFTGDNKELNEILLKAMALTQGLQAIQSIVDARKQAGAIASIFVKKQEAAASVEVAAATEAEAAATDTATVAFGGLKTAILATGIGALLVGIGLLIANFDKITAWFSDNKKDAAELRKEHEDAIVAMDKETDLILRGKQLEVDRAEALGKSTTEVNKLRKEYAQLAIERAEQHLNEVKALAEVEEGENKKQLESYAYMKALTMGWGVLGDLANTIFGTSEKQLAEQSKKATDAVNDVKKAELDLQEAKNKSLQLDKDIADQNDKTASQTIENANKAKKAIDDMRIDLMDDGPLKDMAKAEQHAKDLIDGFVGTLAQREAYKAEVEAWLAKTKKEIGEKAQVEMVDIPDPIKQMQADEMKAMDEKMDHFLVTNKAIEKQDEKDKADQLAREKAFRQKMNDIASEAAEVAGQIEGAIGDMEETRRNNELAAAGSNQQKQDEINRKYFEDNKKLQTATAIINGLVAITKIAATDPEPVSQALRIAAQIASTAATVGKIQSTQYTSTSAGGSAAATPAPINPTQNLINRQALAMQQAQQNQQQNNNNNNNQSNQPPVIRTYVVDSDIALSQQRMDKIARLSTH